MQLTTRKKRTLIQAVEKIGSEIIVVQAAGEIEVKASNNDFTRREFIKYNGLYTEE